MNTDWCFLHFQEPLWGKGICVLVEDWPLSHSRCGLLTQVWPIRASPPWPLYILGMATGSKVSLRIRSRNFSGTTGKNSYLVCVSLTEQTGTISTWSCPRPSLVSTREACLKISQSRAKWKWEMIRSRFLTNVSLWIQPCLQLMIVGLLCSFCFNQFIWWIFSSLKTESSDAFSLIQYPWSKQHFLKSQVDFLRFAGREKVDAQDRNKTGNNFSILTMQIIFLNIIPITKQAWAKGSSLLRVKVLNKKGWLSFKPRTNHSLLSDTAYSVSCLRRWNVRESMSHVQQTTAGEVTELAFESSPDWFQDSCL